MEVARDIATALDPARLFHKAEIGTPDPWQGDVLRGNWTRLLLNITRQGGKSTTVAALACHEAIYTPDSLTLITAPAERQAKETLAKFWAFYRALGFPVGVEKKSELRAQFANGSRVIALPGKEQTIRGYSGVDLLILDEAARVPDELYNAVKPMLAVSDGRIAALSTPWGQRGWYWRAWTDPGQTWERVRVTAEECPRISEEFLEQERREMPDSWFLSEYFCEFTDTVDSVFSTSDIDAMQTADVPPLFDRDASDTLTDTGIPTL